MPRLSAEDWTTIRVEYEAGASANSLADKYGVTHTAINKRRGKEGWIQNLDALIAKKVSEKVSGLVSSETAEKRAEVVDEEAEKRADVIRRHRQEWIQVATIRQEAAEKRGTSPTLAQDRAKLAKIFAEITTLQQAGERKAWGLDATVDVRKLTDEQLVAIVKGREP